MVEQRRQLDDPVGGLVALEPEFENYLARVSPDNRRRLREVALGMSPQQQQEFLASMQMGDIEFQADIMPYMPEGADLIDPLVARTHGVPSDDAPDPVFSKEGTQINPRGLLGRYVPSTYEGDPEKLGRGSVYKMGKSGRFYGFPLESDTVNIYEPSAANPQIWAHEYRHRQDLEGGRGEFGVKEILNRTQDVINANNPRDLRQALAPLAGTLADWSSAFAFKKNRRNRIIRGVSEFREELDKEIDEFQQYMRKVQEDTHDPDVPHAKLVEHAKNILNSKFIQNEFEANEVRASSYRENPAFYAEPPPLKERMTREDFREGRVYKNEIDTSFFDRFSNGGLVEQRQLDDPVGGIDPRFFPALQREQEVIEGFFVKDPEATGLGALRERAVDPEIEAYAAGALRPPEAAGIPFADMSPAEMKGVYETLLTLGTGLGSGTASIPYGFTLGYKAPMSERTPFADVGVPAAMEFAAAGTYEPRTAEGQRNLQSLSDTMADAMKSLHIDDAIAYINEEIKPKLQAAFGADATKEIFALASLMGSRRIDFLRDRVRYLTGNLEQDTTMPLATRRRIEREVREFSKELRERLGPPEPEPPSKIQAYHGSQADFDEFSSDYIGTGEGAQAYGYGHYLAENEDVSRIYYDKLAKFPTATDKDSLARNLVDDYHYGDFESLEDAMLEQGPRVRKEAFQNKIIYKFDDNSGIELDFKKWDETGDLDSSLRPIDLSSGAHMYRVEIDATPDELLDWDLPISQQSQFVKDRMRELAQDGNPVANEFVAGAEGISPHLDQRMDLIYDKMAKGSDGWDFPGASETFKNAGIKGIRYKDGFSRGKEGGTSNYVIFDGRLITISKKYGVAIPIAAAMLAKETGQDPTSFYSEDNLVQQKAQGGPVGDPSMYRADGSRKSARGFLGPIKNLVSGGTMTEFSTDLGDEKRTPIPTMVPTQTPEAIEYMRNMRGGRGWDTENNPMHKQIIDTARAHARMRISQGKSPFYQDGEDSQTAKAQGGPVGGLGVYFSKMQMQGA